MSTKREVYVGNSVIYHDNRGVSHNALVTVVWGKSGDHPESINLIMVSSDENKKDVYGRQIERWSSIQHRDGVNVHGNYWRFENEDPIEYKPPKES